MSGIKDDRLSEEEEWDDAYFTFMEELAKKNASRYEFQADELLKTHKLEFQVNEVYVRYALDHVGCWFSVSEDAGKTFRKKTWNRFGWRKSDKRKALPNFFAKTEAHITFQNQ